MSLSVFRPKNSISRYFDIHKINKEYALCLDASKIINGLPISIRTIEMPRRNCQNIEEKKIFCILFIAKLCTYFIFIFFLSKIVNLGLISAILQTEV